MILFLLCRKMWEYLTNYEVEMTLVRGYLRCTHQIVVSYWCCWATEWERTTKHSVLCWDKRAHWQQRLKTWNVVVAHAVTMTTNKIPTTRPRNATVSTFYHMRNHSVATSHIFYMYYASSFNSAFRHSSFRIVESSYCFCSALIFLLSSLFRFSSFSLLLVLSHWQSLLWIWVWHCVSLCWSIYFLTFKLSCVFFVHVHCTALAYLADFQSQRQCASFSLFIFTCCRLFEWLCLLTIQ